LRRKLCFGLLLLALAAAAVMCKPAGDSDKVTGRRAVAAYASKNFDRLLGMPGFSDTLLKNHFALYAGYVANTNAILEKLQEGTASVDGGSAVYAELRRRLGFEFNGMKLHELYFENLGGNGSPPVAGGLHEALLANFDGFDKWKQDFITTGAMRGVGWVVLYEDPSTGRLMNVWINEHETNHLAGCRPLLVMDVFEHAYMTDYGLDRRAYMDAFFSNLDWTVVGQRFEGGAGISAKAAEAQEVGPAAASDAPAAAESASHGRP